MSGCVRVKPNWWEKCKDSTIVEKWREEATFEISPELFDYAIQELEYFDRLRDGPMEVSRVNDVWKADGLIPEALKRSLQEGVRALEEVPDHLKDWHPDSDDQVLDLVHPSLYPVRSGVTLQVDEDKAYWELPVRGGSPVPFRERSLFESADLQWLPTDFLVSPSPEDPKKVGKVTIQSYINNLLPIKQASLYKAIAGIFGYMVPMFEKTLMSLINPLPGRVDMSSDWYPPKPERNKEEGEEVNRKEEKEGEEGKGKEEKEEEEEEKGKEEEEEEEKEDWRKAMDSEEEWMEKREPIQPLPKPYVPYPLPQKRVSLVGKTLQVIVKLANIHLTPEKPRYPGGSWHVEGMRNEGIVASGIYYYHSSNITPSRLAFRTAVCEPGYEQNDDKGVSAIYGLANEEPLCQPLGYEETIEDRCLVFPNLYQHRVRPFRLLDPSKPGVRKILVFFLVNPGQPILSSSRVPLQSAAMLAEMLKWCLGPLGLFPELYERIAAYLEIMSWEEAKQSRKALMKERKRITESSNEHFFERLFSLCEH
uniref:DUF4246 domain-containing protein n=1 Tax=Arcella intermedia TaxID=1963864 RepID=A0A6B2L1E3_9EUKA